MKQKVYLALLLIGNSLMSQNLDFKLSDTYTSMFGAKGDLISLNPLFKLEGDVIHNKTESKDIVALPKQMKTAEIAYGFLHFMGIDKQAFKNEVAFLVENYNAENPSVFIDENGNLDFTDDDSPINFLNTAYTIKLSNSSNKNGVYHHWMSKANSIEVQNQDKVKQFYGSKFPNSSIIHPSKWFISKRLPVRFSKIMIDNKPVTILLHDQSSDGIFTFNSGDFGDRIAIVEKHIDIDEDLTQYLRLGEAIHNFPVFKIYEKNYNINELSESGNEISFKETNKKINSKTTLDSNILSLKIKLIDNSVLSIQELLKNGKYLLLDFGGTWCASCITQEPIIKEMHGSNRLNVVGIFGHDTKESISKHIKKHQIKWPVAMLSKELKSVFNINAYPTYILVSPSGKIKAIDINAQAIKKQLK